MKRLLFVVVLGALMVGASGCDLTPPAATVNGVAISQSTLNGELNTLVSNDKAQCAVQIQAGLSSSPVGTGTESDGTTPNAVTPAFADNVLESLILEQLETQTLARHGAAVTAADVAAAASDYSSQLQSQLSQASSENATPTGCSLSTSSSVAGQLPSGFLHGQAASLAAQEQFEVVVGQVDLSVAALRAYYQSHASEVTQSCLNVLVADSQSAAQTLHDQIAAGTSFATAYKSSDTDTQASPTDGELPCEYPSEVSSQFGSSDGPSVNALATGQLLPVVSLQSTSSTGAATTVYVVVQMRAHELVPFATLRSAIRQEILQEHSSTVGTKLNALVRQARVSIDPRYGSWSVKKGVTVPTPPPPAFVLNAAANVPSPAAAGGFHINLPTG
ncbi:MAG: hypothetical protein ACRDY1_03240 [Acidimicrobiales bacterium]